jgi:fibronectin type 3 domain-containing protein
MFIYSKIFWLILIYSSTYFSENVKMNRTNIPYPPFCVVSTNYQNYIHVEWNNVPNSTKYIIRRSLTPNFDDSSIIATITQNHFDDYTTHKYIRYYYWVNTIDKSGFTYYDKSKYTYGWRK